MCWEVTLVGDTTDLAMLEQSFNGPDLNVLMRGEEYVLASPEFALLGEARAIHKRALDLIKLVNGACRIALDSRTPIRSGGVVFRHRDGRRDIYEFPEPAVVECRVLAPSIKIRHRDGTSETYHPADPVREWVGVAATDAAAAKVLHLLSGGVWDWVNLYRVLEIVEEDCGGTHHIVSQGWGTRKVITRFKHTANSPGATGTEARHGAESTHPPAKPMLLAEAKSLIQGIVQSWLRSKEFRTSSGLKRGQIPKCEDR